MHTSGGIRQKQGVQTLWVSSLRNCLLRIRQLIRDCFCMAFSWLFRCWQIANDQDAGIYYSSFYALLCRPSYMMITIHTV